MSNFKVENLSLACDFIYFLQENIQKFNFLYINIHWLRNVLALFFNISKNSSKNVKSLF